VRYTLIEMAWRILRWQPHYRPLKKLLETLNSKRAKRRLIVALARRLAIDLWRWATKRATAQELGLRLASEKENRKPQSTLKAESKLIWERRVYVLGAGT
jgi:hypothetical protein